MFCRWVLLLPLRVPFSQTARIALFASILSTAAIATAAPHDATPIATRRTATARPSIAPADEQSTSPAPPIEPIVRGETTHAPVFDLAPALINLTRENADDARSAPAAADTSAPDTNAREDRAPSALLNRRSATLHSTLSLSAATGRNMSASSAAAQGSEEPSTSSDLKSGADPLKAAKAANGATSASASPEEGKASASPSEEPSGSEARAGQADENSRLLGEPLAPGMIRLLEQEISAGIHRRGADDAFARFQSYAAGRLNASAGRYTGSELAGNCRLKWYDYLLRHPVHAPALAEQFTRDLHRAVLDGDAGLSPLLAIAAERMDLNVPEEHKPLSPKSPGEALDDVRAAIVTAQSSFAAAIAPLSKSEIRELQSYLYPILVGQNRTGHTLVDRGTGRRLCDLMERIDRSQLYVAADALTALSAPAVLDQLAKLEIQSRDAIDGVTGAAQRIETPAGAIILGGPGANTYQLDKLTDVVAVIDLGGNDGYYEGTTWLGRPVLLVIDLAGDDSYRGQKPGIQGASLLGVSVLIDRAGDDVYEARDLAQGSTLAGVGVLIDLAGNDRYLALRRAQGQAIGGVGLLIDRGGNDDYHAAMWAQGFGGPLGFGLLDDVTGDDHYFCGGAWPDSYEETPGLEGWGQGVGAGLRQVADGGIGVILDGAGDDVYEFDYLAHGGGYWCGLGFARDFAGNDQRLITRKAYDGGARTEPSFQRFGCGWGCHYSLGFLFDDSGNDVYSGTIMGSGMAWDCSEGVLCDFAGNDQYLATGGLTVGVGAQMGIGILFDYNGDDYYKAGAEGYAPPSISYHELPECGGNFSFLIDYGGNDRYGCGARNNSYLQRGAIGGFLVDRPRVEEVERTAQKSSASQ